MTRVWLSGLTLLIMTGSAIGQPPKKEATVDFAKEAMGQLAPPVAPPAQPSEKPSAEVTQAYNDAQKAYYEQYKWSQDNRQRLYGTQYYMSVVVFIASLFIVGMGVAMSFLQFRVFYRYWMHRLTRLTEKRPEIRKHHNGKKMLPPSGTSGKEERVEEEKEDEKLHAGEGEGSEFTFGKDGASIKTPVIGLLVLVVALAYFYLYLQFVYPIH